MKRARAGAWLLGFATIASLGLNVVFLLGPALLAGLLEPPAAIAAPAAQETAAAPETSPQPSEPPKVEPAAEPAPHADAQVSDAAGDDDEDTVDARPPQEGALFAAAAAAAEQKFRRIVRAYENMEPENASAALILLAGRDMTSTVRTLFAMDPRKSGAVLDAMSRKSPQTAAAITSEMLAETAPEVYVPAR